MERTGNVKVGVYVDVSTKGVEFKFEENFFNLLKSETAVTYLFSESARQLFHQTKHFNV